MGPPSNPSNFYSKIMSKPPVGYICNRCGKAGHMIKECPTNSNPDFDPYKGKGVPKNILWKRDLGVLA